ncbi:hypothetical protein A2W24_06900 [Microgenomates group bacterium RBG_16_45_19]|nr:MAG: hypothetical protein A2W24_06900 [Microgenomates group bacterium RBG_16_45_19]
MAVIIFDGRGEARKREQVLKHRVDSLGRAPRLMSLVFHEDQGGQLYTRLKMEAALRVGIEFDREEFSLNDPVEQLVPEVQSLSQRPDVHGLLIQKPTKAVWKQVTGTHRHGEFGWWWQQLTSALAPAKDVDCLAKANLDLVYGGNWRIVPATVKSILSILEIALNLSNHELTNNNELKLKQALTGTKTVVIGRSEIIGRPLAAVMTQAGAVVSLVGSQTEDLGQHTASAKIVISATGVPKLIKEDLIRPGAVVIDVGSPAGDVDFEAVKDEVAFITPVPGGVGPMTVVSLLENLVEMI